MDSARKAVLEASEAQGGMLAIWSRELGRNDAYLHQWINKGSPVRFPEHLRAKLSELSGVSEQILQGSALKNSRVAARISIPKPSKDDFRFLGAYDQGASAGPGSYVESGALIPMHHLAFRRDWLREITSAGDDDLFVLFADGNSMTPTIHHGDTMLVDKTQTNPRKDGIFVFVSGDLLNVKRLTWNPRAKTISISSDNPVHKSFDGAKPDEVEVIGRVIWIGRKV